MQYRPFGKTGYDVSLLGMGCMRFPRSDDGKIEREKAYEMVRYAVDNGVNYFDTALGYPSSEEVLGEALDGISRDKIKIATKHPFWNAKLKDTLRRDLESSLKKLRTDYLDVYLIHCITKDSWPNIKSWEILKEYEKFRDEGLIKAIAFSYHGEYETFAEILNAYDWDMCQVQHNFIDTDREVTAKGIELAGEKGCAVVIMEPLLGGNLSNEPKIVSPIYGRARVQRSPVEWAFRYTANFPQASTILSGMTTLKELKQNIELFSCEDMTAGNLNDADLAMLAEVRTAYKSVVAIPCTTCKYCVPCPQKVDIPGVFDAYNAAKMYEMVSQPRRVYSFLTKAKKDAGNCTACGECESKCPQNVKIIDGLKKSHELLKGWVEL